MHPKAPRPRARQWQQRTRGALLTAGLWLAASAQAPLADTIVAARYAEPTTRYAHGVLGDDIEYGALLLEIGPRRTLLTIRLPRERVFEDLAPRLVDVTGDGHPEVMVIESHRDQGARLAIYTQDGLLAATPYIGTPFRWLAPLGAADLDGDGHIEIAYVDRPHLAKTLRIWRYHDAGLTQVATLPGLTNHRIGEDFISGGIRDCGTGPELILANANWTRIQSVSYDGKWQVTDLGPYTGHQGLAASLTC